MKKPAIEVLSASAGTGKTFTLVERLYEELKIKSAVMATTFTVAAAQELTERVRVKLYKEGEIDLALKVREGKFGTVNSICDYLVRRYAFSAGVSPELEVIGEREQRVFFSQATAAAFAGKTERMSAISRRFAFESQFGKKDSWEDAVLSLVSTIRTNNLGKSYLD